MKLKNSARNTEYIGFDKDKSDDLKKAQRTALPDLTKLNQIAVALG
jgi:hypothetical protein